MNTKRLVMIALTGAVVTGLVVVSRVGGGIASFLPPEVLMSLVAIAGLFGHAFLDLRDGAPRSLDLGLGLRRRFRRAPAKPAGEVIPLFRSDDRAAA